MKILALIIAAYTLPMLLIHVSTAAILKAWNGDAGSWIKERFPPRRALRVEALYWALCLGAWPLWRAAAWEMLVVLFAAIHLGIWLSGEFGKAQLSGNSGGNPVRARRLEQAIVTFDLIEAAMLVAVGWLSVLFLLRAG